MDKKLRNLRQSMKKTVFKDLIFNEKHQEAIRREINQENVLEAVLQLLVQEKTGVELMKLLRARGIKKFEGQEGFLYTLLHQLEQKGYLISRWSENEIKHYMLNDKGRKALNKIEKSEHSKSILLKEVFGGNIL